MKNRATSKQIEEAKNLIAKGKGPNSVSLITGICLKTAQKIQQQYLKEHPTESMQVRRKSDNALPLEPEVSSRLMNQDEIDKYGPPRGVKLDDVPKDFVLRIGPVGVDAAADVVKSTVEAMRILGAADVTVTIETAKPEGLK